MGGINTGTPIEDFAHDVLERCSKARESLRKLIVESASIEERNRLNGKIEGIGLVEGYVIETRDGFNWHTYNDE